MYPPSQVNRLITLTSAFIFYGLNFFACLQAQDWARSDIKTLHRVDMRNLGYPLVNEIPANSSAITSLLTAKNGKIYGGTTGETAYLLLFDPKNNKVRHLGKMEGEESIHHALVEDKRGHLYLGTGKNMFKPFSLSSGGIGEDNPIDNALWEDIKSNFSDYPGGHLFRYCPEISDKHVKLSQMACEVQDLGIPVAKNSIYALTIDPERDNIYGLSYPDGRFFIYEIQKAMFTDLGEIDSERVFKGPERWWRSVPRALVCDNRGRVFTTGTGGMIVYYDPALHKIVYTDLRIPSDEYPERFYTTHPVVECMDKDAEGLIYGGTSDGLLFSLDTENLMLDNLGKVRAVRRLRTLTVGLDGKVYFMAGERPETSPSPCQFYCYHPNRSHFEKFGLLIVDRSPNYYWRGYQFDSMTTGLDGTIYIGERERRSHLFIFLP